MVQKRIERRKAEKDELQRSMVMRDEAKPVEARIRTRSEGRKSELDAFEEEEKGRDELYPWRTRDEVSLTHPREANPFDDGSAEPEGGDGARDGMED